jgi:hypothetical protein
MGSFLRVLVAGTGLTRPGVDRDPDGGVPRPVLFVRLDATVIDADGTKKVLRATIRVGSGFIR